MRREEDLNEFMIHITRDFFTQAPLRKLQRPYYKNIGTEGSPIFAFFAHATFDLPCAIATYHLGSGDTTYFAYKCFEKDIHEYYVTRREESKEEPTLDGIADMVETADIMLAKLTSTSKVIANELKECLKKIGDELKKLKDKA